MGRVRGWILGKTHIVSSLDLTRMRIGHGLCSLSDFICYRYLYILTTSCAVASLAPNSTLISSDAKEAAIVDQWIAFADASIAGPTSFVLKLVKGVITPYNKPVRS